MLTILAKLTVLDSLLIPLRNSPKTASHLDRHSCMKGISIILSKTWFKDSLDGEKMSLLLIFHLILDNSYTCVTIKYSLRIKNQSLKIKLSWESPLMKKKHNDLAGNFINFGISRSFHPSITHTVDEQVLSTP